MPSSFSPERYQRIISLNVDIQNDFCPGGTLAVKDGDQVISPMNRINRYVRSLGGVVLFTRDWHPRVTNHFNTHGGPWPPHCVAYTAGAAFPDELLVDTGAGDIVASKGVKPNVNDYSGASAVVDGMIRSGDRGGIETRTTVEQVVRYASSELPQYRQVSRSGEGKTAVFVGGLATDYCVKATVLDLLDATYARRAPDVYLVTDAIRAVDLESGDGDRAIEEMQKAGAIVVSSEVLLGEASGENR